MSRAILFFSLLFLRFDSALAQELGPRILVLGDSWSVGLIGANAYGEEGYNALPNTLAEYGLSDVSVHGSATARGGATVHFWSERDAELIQELESHPSIELVYVVLGGGDIVRLVASDAPLIEGLHKIRLEFEQLLLEILAVRPNIKIWLSGYDYVNAELAGETLNNSWKVLGQYQLNVLFDWWTETQRHIAQHHPRIGFSDNLGRISGLRSDGNEVSMCAFEAADASAESVRLIINPRKLLLESAMAERKPTWVGNCRTLYRMPARATVGDGVHPSAQAHRVILRHAFSGDFLKNLYPRADCGQNCRKS